MPIVHGIVKDHDITNAPHSISLANRVHTVAVVPDAVAYHRDFHARGVQGVYYHAKRSRENLGQLEDHLMSNLVSYVGIFGGLWFLYKWYKNEF